MKKLLAILLCVVLSLSLLAGCGGSGDSGKEDTKKEDQAKEDTKKDEPAKEDTKKDEPAKEDTEEEPGDEPGDEPGGDDIITDFGGAKITVIMYGGTPEQAGAERVFGKINDYFKEKWNIDVDIQFLTFGNYVQNTNMILSAGEPCDIFCSGQLNFTSTVANESCYDMYEDDLIQKYGKGILDLVDSAFLKGCTVDGHLYGIPTMRDLAVGMWCIVIAKQYMDGIGYDYSNIDTEACNPATPEEMTDLFEKLHAQYPDINVIYPWGRTLLNQKFVYDPIGGDDFGVLLDPANSLEVSDLFSSDMFMDYCKLMREWQLKGFISKDAATETEGGGAQIRAGTLMADTTGGKPGIVRQKEVERGDMDSIAFQMGPDFVRAEQATVAAWSINSDCENPEAAMVVLNALYTDEVVTNLILWGEEGVDYVFTDDGHIDFPEGITKETSEYYNITPAWALPCEYTTHVRVGDALDLWPQTIKYNNESMKSKAIGFSFDKSEYSAEYTALINIWDEMAPALLYGMVDPEEEIPKLIERLKGAGLDEYIQAKREALEKWAAGE